MQFIIVPIITISLGVFISIKTRSYLTAPVITFLLSFTYTKLFLNTSVISSWEVILPMASLIISLSFRYFKKLEKEIYKK